MDLFAHPVLSAWFRRKEVCVVGLGKSGLAAAAFLKRLGARVSVTEKQPRQKAAKWVRELPPGVFCETGSHRLLRRSWDLLVISPGVPAEVWKPHAAAGRMVWGEMELGYRALSLAGRWPRRAAAVTGTNGKTTTTALLGEICRAAGFHTVVAGNIGTPLCAVAHRLDAGAALVLEVSSYQLETACAFHPAAGVVMNVTPDHLKRHRTMKNYAEAKFRLFQNFLPEETAVLNAADPWCRRLARTVPGKIFWFGRAAERRGRPGVFFDGKRLRAAVPGGRAVWDPPRYLRGYHNVENAMAAAACGLALGAGGAAVRKSFERFRGVEHRLEEVRCRNGVHFVNDSKATNVDSTAVALRSFVGGLHLILGGQDKGS
ncbi:MAG TPA: UDP-N-acetylmuramoyl-L-alanine--D-glutamate ligase, partial [Elusimicrobiota bacterium]|nr:UDP-N-acetylmuramoyl-L-alanine--D-glutamate ligase [Elusimicrobiota bacterium]